MFRAVVMYPYGDDATFDMDYYLETHCGLVDKLIGPMEGYKGLTIDKGLGGALPGDPPPFQLIAVLNFETLEALQNAMGTHAPQLMGDIPNFTNVQPQVVISKTID